MSEEYRDWVKNLVISWNLLKNSSLNWRGAAGCVDGSISQGPAILQLLLHSHLPHFQPVCLSYSANTCHLGLIRVCTITAAVFALPQSATLDMQQNGWNTAGSI